MSQLRLSAIQVVVYVDSESNVIWILRISYYNFFNELNKHVAGFFDKKRRAWTKEVGNEMISPYADLGRASGCAQGRWENCREVLGWVSCASRQLMVLVDREILKCRLAVIKIQIGHLFIGSLIYRLLLSALSPTERIDAWHHPMCLLEFAVDLWYNLWFFSWAVNPTTYSITLHQASKTSTIDFVYEKRINICLRHIVRFARICSRGMYRINAPFCFTDESRS